MSIGPIQDVVSSSAASRPVQTSAGTAAAPFANADSVSVSSSNGSAYSSLGSSVGLAQLGSLLEVASSGTQHINAVLTQLQQLAAQAQDSTGSTLAQLNGEFQQLLSGLDQITSGTTFGGSTLLDGTLGSSSPDNSALSAAIQAAGQNSITLSIPSLTAQSLFGNTQPAVSTPQSAQSAYNAVVDAQATVTSAYNGISDAQSQASYAAANVSAAQANSEASAATLSESDFSDGLDIFAGILSTPGVSADAQTGNLPSSLLALLHE